MEIHDFYCINCGQRGLPIVRRHSLQHEKFHRKKLYCPWCKMTVNHIECRNDEEAFEFKQAFENGEYAEEAEESLRHGG